MYTDDDDEDDELLDDSIEKDSKYRHIFAHIDREVEEALSDSSIKEGVLGYCHIFWDTKKEILWKKYHIRWKTPAEMNPDVMFD
jgi:hypothetical protein